MESRLQDIEESSFPITSTKTTPTSKSSTTSRHTYVSKATSDPMTISDLGESPIGVSAAAKFHPTRDVVKPKTNPLYRTLPGVKYAGLVGRELMSDSSEMDSDLDGHTLSGSLGLLSDIEGKSVAKDLSLLAVQLATGNGIM